MNGDVFIRAVHHEMGQGSTISDRLLADLRRADDFTRLAVLAGAGALGDYADDDEKLLEVGVFLGSTIGPLETNFRFLDTLLDNGERQCSPTLFTHSVHNAAVGYVTKLLKIQGPSLTVTTPGWPFLTALAEAKTALENKKLSAALVLAVEEENPLLAEARDRSALRRLQQHPPAEKALSTGAIAWLLTVNGGEDPSPLRLHKLVVEEKVCDPAFYLHREGESFEPAYKEARGERPPRPLVSVLSLCHALRSKPAASPLSWTVTAPCGRASVVIS